MEWTTPPLVPAATPLSVVTPAIEPAAPTTTSTGFGMRRAVMTAALWALLLVGGAAAAVSAASPDPSTAPSTTAPSGGSSGTGTQPAPRQHGSGSTVDCPNMGGDGGSGTTPSAPTTPTTPAPTPAT